MRSTVGYLELDEGTDAALPPGLPTTSGCHSRQEYQQLQERIAPTPYFLLPTPYVWPLHFYTETGKIQIESKKDMKKRGVSSPDFADALVLAFASNAAWGWVEQARIMASRPNPMRQFDDW